MTPPTPPTTVIKVGGSLFAWPGLPAALARLLNDLPLADSRPLLLAGGGAFVDTIRHLDQAQTLGEATSHTLAMHALDFTAHVLGALLPNLRSTVVSTSAEASRAWSAALIPILAPGALIGDDDRTSDAPLEHAWRVTSDTIAARCAERLHCPRLILCKSAPLGNLRRLSAAREAGLVDPAFPGRAQTCMRIIYRNLRDSLDRGTMLT